MTGTMSLRAEHAADEHVAAADTRGLALMYHYARDRLGPPLSAIRGHSAASFITEIDDIAGRFPGRAVFTFDDGLSDHVDVAAPALERHGLRGVFLVSGRPLADGQMLAAHMVHLLMCHLGNERLAELLEQRLLAADPSRAWERSLDRQAACQMYHYEPPALAEMKYLLHVALPIELRDRVVCELFAEYVGTQRDWVPRWYGTTGQWADLQARGHVIGGHGYAHEPLDRLSCDEAAEDVRRSMQFLRDTFGDRPRPFSYPFGSFNDSVVDAVRSAGFTCAYTTVAGWNRGDADPWRLHRVDTAGLDTFLRRSNSP